MDSLQANYRDEDEGDDAPSHHPTPNPTNAIESSDPPPEPPTSTIEPQRDTVFRNETVTESGAEPQNGDLPLDDIRPEPETESAPSDSLSEDDPTASSDTQKSPKLNKISAQNGDVLEDEDDDEDDHPPKKQKQLSSLTSSSPPPPPPPSQDAQQQKQPTVATTNSKNVNVATKTTPTTTTTTIKKSKKKSNNVWVTKTSRKGKKKNKANTQTPASAEEKVLITPVPRFPDKGDDGQDMQICLSKVYKAEKVELSDDRLSAGSTKGYRMVRATRGVLEGAWYFEIKVVKLGETGHTRLGWSTEKGDLQAPVGYDGNSFGYRDVDGSKVHKALREKYGEEGYKEGDVIGFYINLPEGRLYTPKPPHLVWYKGQRYVCAPDAKEDPPKVVPGSEISFFKNGVCQGVAFKDLYGGRYYPAASMYTLPNQPNCMVKFNFGPDFECFPEDFGERPVPCPMVEIPYHGVDSRVENGVSNDKKQ